jgi:hypothetical protein
MVGSRPEIAATRGSAATLSRVVMVTTSPPTRAFSSSGVPIAWIVPWSMIAIRSQDSASSM